VKKVASAVSHAIETTAPDGAICIAGSLYVVGEAKQALINIVITDSIK
jgi:dihydrofolate synthase/folylpolyglutamate synthase